ncbi:MAG: Ig-like domain-containing protein [Clostridia bacterium]
MKKATSLMMWLLVLTLLATPMSALAAEQATVKATGMLCTLSMPNGETIVVDGTAKEKAIGMVEVVSPEEGRLELPNGEWHIRHLNGAPIVVKAVPSTDPLDLSMTIVLEKGTIDQAAEFLVTFTSDALTKELTRHFTVEIEDPLTRGGYTDYQYGKTEHTVKTGATLFIDKGTPLPEGAYPTDDITVVWDTSALDPLKDRAGTLDLGEGALGLFICDPGTYKLTSRVYLYSNFYKETVHTVTVTGKPVEQYMPFFDIEVDNYNPTLLSSDDATVMLTALSLADMSAYEGDAFTWRVEQTAGEPLSVDLEYDPLDGREAALNVSGALPAGSYTFKVTLTDTTRDDTATANVELTVLQLPLGQTLPTGIVYKQVTDPLVLQAGDVIKLKKPTFLPANAKLPADKGMYDFEVNLDDVDDAIASQIIRESDDDGRHTIIGAVPGTYKLHLTLVLYDNSVYCDQAVTLIIMPGLGTKVNEIKLDKEGTEESPLTLGVGEKVKVGATVLPSDAANKDLFWTCENHNVTVTDKGVITGQYGNSTDIVYVRAADGSGIARKIYVQVFPEQVTKLVPEKKKVSLDVGESTQLKIKKFIPNFVTESMRNVLWFSDDPTIADVDMISGVVTGTKVGKTKIKAYATMPSGLGYDIDINKNVFATCVVTVKPGKAGSIAFTRSTPLEITVGAKGIKLIDMIEFAPYGSTGKVTFKSDTPSVAKVSKKGVLTAVAPGQATITATLKGEKETATLLVSVLIG